MNAQRSRRAGLGALWVAVLFAACTGEIHTPPGHVTGGSGGPSGSAPPADGGTTVSSGPDAGMGTVPFNPDTPAVYVAKVKNLLVGLPPTDSEVQAVVADPTQLGTLVDGWMQLPEYQTKMQRFFELAFQQAQIAGTDFHNEIFPAILDSEGWSANLMLQNTEESFARTMVYNATHGVPFNEGMWTQTVMMTTALRTFYAFADAYQVGNTVNCGNGAATDAFAAEYPNLNMYFTATPIPLSESVDAGSPNFMHWYDPDVADAGCASDPMIVKANGNFLYKLLLGDLFGATDGKCSSFHTYQGPIQAADFSDWSMTTINQPAPGQQTTPFWDLPFLRTTNTLVLSLPHVSFFTTPAFFANWQTNASNQMRVTMNQTLIVALGQQIDGSNITVPTSTPGLDSQHAAPGTACYTCHMMLDPTRSVLASTFSWNYGAQPDMTFASQPGLFAFGGVQANVKTMSDLGKTLGSHPMLAAGWAQKLCYYVNSEACLTTDPEFQRIVSLFQSSGYSWNQLVKAVMTSPLTTHAASTLTATTSGKVVAVARRDHLCASLSARLGLQDACGLDAALRPVIPGAALTVVGGLPSDGYSRGSTVPVLPTQPTLFIRGGAENLCEAFAGLLIDNKSAPAGAKTWSSTNPTAAISDFVSIVMGIPPSDARNAGLQQLLTAHFNAAKQTTSISATAALQSTFTAACMSPSAISIGI